MSALAYGLDLFSTALEENDGDGPGRRIFSTRRSSGSYCWLYLVRIGRTGSCIALGAAHVVSNFSVSAERMLLII